MIDKKLLLITALLLASCTSDPMTDATDGGSQIPATSHKIVNTSIDAEAGSLLVYFDDAAIGSLEQAAEAAAKTRSVATRAGIVSVDEILSELNVSSLNRLFPVNIHLTRFSSIFYPAFLKAGQVFYVEKACPKRFVSDTLSS